MILLEGFLVRLMIGISKNPSRRIINVTFLSKRTRLKAPTIEKAEKNVYFSVLLVIVC